MRAGFYLNGDVCSCSTGLRGGDRPPEQMWCSPRGPTGSDRVRLGGVVLPADTSAALRRLLSGPLHFASVDQFYYGSFESVFSVSS